MAEEPFNEIFEIIDEKGKVIGKEKRGIVHEKGLLHRSSHVFVLDKKDKIFIQQRSFDKLSCPGLWDFSAAEHLQAGETYAEAAERGIKEELGVEPVKLESIGKTAFKSKAGNFCENEQEEIFKCWFKGKIKIDEGEVVQGKWISKEDLLKELAYNSESFTPWLLNCKSFLAKL